MAVTLVNTDNVLDVEDADFNLSTASAVANLTINGRTFLYVTSLFDDGVSVFEVNAAGTLSNVENVNDADNANLLLNGATDIATVLIDGQPFMFATGFDDEGISGFAALANGGLVSPAATVARPLGPANHNNSGSVFFQLAGARDVVSAAVGGNTYLFVAGADDDGVEVLSVANDGTLVHAHSVNDAEGVNRQLNGVENLATATVGGTTYLFAAGQLDDGISVFSVAANGVLTHVDSVDDSEDPALRLDIVEELTTAVVGAKTFLFAASVGDDGISVFEVAANGILTHVFNIVDNPTLALDNVFGLEAFNIAGTTYVVASGEGEDGISVFAVAADGTLLHQTTIFDDLFVGLNIAFDFSTAVVNGNTFLFVPDAVEDSVSAFRVDTTGLTISGTAGNDTINALNSAPGQLLPSELGDTISGLGGTDNIDGLGGGDTIIGGAQADILNGGAGDDIFRIAGVEGLGDTFIGGTETDRILVTGAGNVTLAGFNAGVSSIEAWQGNNQGVLGTAAANVFNFAGLGSKTGLLFVDAGDGNDTLVGSNFADDLRGGDGTDSVDGGLGNDILQITGDEALNDAMDGGGGIDTLQVVGEAAATLAAFNAAASAIETWQGNNEGLLGTGGADLLQLRRA